MADDITLNPERTNRTAQSMQFDEIAMHREAEGEGRGLQSMRQRQAQGVPCPHCGEINDAESMYCAFCGKPLGLVNCPNCGSEIDPDADFCESCHHYIKNDVCSFCGSYLTGHEAYCPECGNPRGGIVCPTCHTLNDFAFCKQCGTALTEEAKTLVKELKQTAEYKELSQLVDQYTDLNMQLPYQSERDVIHEQENSALRQRVLLLLAQDRGVSNPVIPKKEITRMRKEELEARKRELLDKLSEVLEKMEMPPMPSSAKARNYAMAQKPAGVRLAWVCNYKNAMHSSPCGCAKPQLGGKWVILGKNSKQEIKDDK